MSSLVERGTHLTQLALATLLFTWTGCGKQEAKQPPPAPPISPTSCKDFAERLCAEVTNVSPLCKAVREVSDVMADEACAAALTNFNSSVQKIADKRKPCIELVDRLCADLGPTTGSCNTVKTSTPSFSVERCTAMLGTYADVLKPLKVQEDKLKPLSPEAIAKIADVTTAPTFGPADAKVTVVEFYDFEDPYSGRATAVMSEVLEKYGKQVRVVFRQYPVPAHRNSHTAAQAALAAHAQGKFLVFYDKLFNNQTQLGRASIEIYAKESKLDVAKLKAALDDKTYAPAVDADYKLGEEVVVDRPPGLFVNGKRVSNPLDPNLVGKEIEEALKTAS